MPKFSYLACTVKGESVEGSLLASDKTEVVKMLSTKGLFMVSCKVEDAPPPVMRAPAAPSSPAAPRPAARSPHAAAPPKVASWLDTLTHKTPNPKEKPKGKVSLKELTVLTRQLSISIHAD